MKQVHLAGILFVLAVTFLAPVAQSQQCPGCENITPPGNPIPDTFSWLDLTGFITVASGDVTTTVSNTSGICAYHWYGPPVNLLLCEPLIKCKSHVTITVNVDDSHPTNTMTFTISAGGTICNVGHSSGSTTITGDGTWIAFDGIVEYACGTQCNIDTSYKVSGTVTIPVFGTQHFGPSTLRVFKTLACDPCASP